jgi:phosphate-selective porin
VRARIAAALGALACAHASLADAGRDGSFFIAQGDAFRLEVSGFVQFRWVGASRDAPQQPDFEHGFDIRRLRLTFEGTALDPRLSYKVTASFSRDGGDAGFSDAYIAYAIDDELIVRAGQFKLPLLAEELMSAKRQLAVDRSLTNGVFTLRRSQAVALEWERGPWLAAGAISDGADAAETGWENDEADFAATARLEHTLDGDPRQFRSFSAERDTAFGWRVGAAAHYQLGADRPGVAQNDFVTWTLESLWQGDGWNAFLAYIGRHETDDPVVGSATDHGVVAQAGRFLTDDIEGFLRWDGVIPDADRPGDELFQAVTVGANWYLHGQALKLTADVQWFPDRAIDNDLVSTSTRVGYLDDGADRNEVVVRAQLQLLF